MTANTSGGGGLRAAWSAAGRRALVPARLATLVFVAAAGAGCNSLLPSSAPVRYYALSVPAAIESTSAKTGAAGAREERCAIRFGIRPVSIPGYLDRDEIIVDRRGSELVLSQSELWAAPLRMELTRAIAETLAARWPGSRRAAFPWRFGETPAWVVDVVFEQLDPLAGTLSVRARWALAATGTEAQPGVEIASGRYDARVALGAASAASTADAIGSAVAELSARIAAEGRAALASRDSACG